ncbi:hypothetical protein ACLKA6_010915 [Drosophila palustris]
MGISTERSTAAKKLRQLGKLGESRRQRLINWQPSKKVSPGNSLSIVLRSGYMHVCVSVLSKGLLCLPHGCCPAQRHFDVSNSAGSSMPRPKTGEMEKEEEEEEEQPDRPRPKVSLVRLIYVFVLPPQHQLGR